MYIYLDNAASTIPLKKCVEAFSEVSLKSYANPSGMSIFSFQAEKIIQSSKKTISKYLSCNEDEIYFTSGGTESNNIAILGITKAYKRDGKHIITTKIEHSAIAMPFESLREEGFEIDYVSVDEKGYVNIENLKSLIKKETILVSIIAVNNEIGTVQNIENIGKVIKDCNEKTIFHIDAVQGFGKININVKKSNISLLSASAHKFHSVKGSGILYIKNNTKIKPITFGGGQQRGIRSGTENAPACLSMEIAIKEAYENLENNNNYVLSLKTALWKGISENIENVYVNGDLNASPYILNVAFSNLRSEVLLHSLEEKNIIVSSGSACNSKKETVSSVLKAINVDEKDINGSIRFSFSKFNTIEEINYTIDILKEIVPFLRKFNR